MEVNRNVIIAVSPRRVWEAITDPKLLQTWCCEEAEISESRYILKGDSVFSGKVGGQIVKCVDEQSLVFEWDIDNKKTRVHIQLEGVDQDGFPPATFTSVNVNHLDIPDMMIPGSDRQMDKWFFDCIWALWQRQLKLWLEKAEIPRKFDYVQTAKMAINQSIVIDQKPEIVWQYFIDVDFRKRWLDLDIGDEVGRDEGRMLKHTWIYESFPSVVTWELTPLADDRTLVTVRHEGMPDTYNYDHNLGWNDYLVSLSQTSARPLIRQTTIIEANKDHVWKFIGTEEGLRQWWNPETLFEPNVGGDIIFGDYGVKLFGRVVDYVPGRLLSFTWQEDESETLAANPLLLTIELSEAGDGTRVTLTHSGFEKLPSSMVERTFKSYQNGWSDAQELPRLKAAIAESMHVKQ